MPEPSSSAPLKIESRRGGRIARARAMRESIARCCTTVGRQTGSFAPCRRVTVFTARRESWSTPTAAVPTWSLCAPTSTYSAARAGSEPGSTAITLRAGAADACQPYDHCAESDLPPAPTASPSTARPKILSAAAREIVAPITLAPSPGMVAGLIEERGLTAALLAASLIPSSPITSTPTAPASSARRSRAAGAGPAGRAGGRGLLRAAASTSAAAAAPNLFGRSAQLASAAGSPAPADPAPSAARKTAILPLNRAGSSVTAVSPHRPAKTAAAVARTFPV